MTSVDETKSPRMALLAPVLFSITVFLSASLLFFVQPLFAKIVLPEIGGAPAVWTTAMLFFQTVLIAGYLYAHLMVKFVRSRVQLAIHLTAWALALLFLPLAVPESWQFDASGDVAMQTLGLFAVSVGVPFFVLSANAPLIQAWYARSGGPSADDPYFLYGISNFGSLLALLAFPFLAEPFFGARAIGIGFAIGFVALGAALLASGLCVRRAEAPAAGADHSAAPKLSAIGYWAALAFVPSSLMLAVTTKVSVDLGAFPLVWVGPLVLYLLSFVLTFTNIYPSSRLVLTTVGLLGMIACGYFFYWKLHEILTLTDMVLLIGAFFLIALWAHRSLYEARPSAGQLTAFYLTMSVGGALGGLFNSILAPLMFDDIYEGLLTFALIPILILIPFTRMSAKERRRSALVGVVGAVIIVGIVSSGLLRKPGVIFQDRSFFGVHTVRDGDEFRLYLNGTTLHGIQISEEIDAERPTPIAYYHPDGAMGQLLQSDIGAEAQSVGIVGLGVGALACYARDGQQWHLYEIDRMVRDIATDPAYFTFVPRCLPDAPIHLGDARVVLEGQTDLTFDILVIDAYSSDAVPVHLTTLDAMQLYLDRLSEDGVLLYHISNRYYDIGVPLARSAEALGVSAWRKLSKEAESDIPGFQLSDVVMIARSDAAVREIVDQDGWAPLPADGGVPWTDDFANVLSILKWRLPQ